MTILDDARPGFDDAIRPQDDLFGHVNGRWLAETEIPADRSVAGSFITLVDNAEEAVRAIIEELSATAQEPGSDAQKIGDLYAAFLDEAAVAARGAEPARPWLAELAAVDSLAALAAFLGRFERVGGQGVFGSYVNTDDRASDSYVVNLVQGGLGLPEKTYYTDEKFADIRTAYAAYLDRLAALGAPVLGGLAFTGADLLDLETRLAAGHWDKVDTRDREKTYNKHTLDELRALTPAFDWAVFADALSDGRHTAAHLLAESIVRQPSYFETLALALTEVPLERWKGYLAAHVLRWASPYLTDDFVDLNFDFYGRTLNGTPELRARWKRGVSLVEGALGEAVGREYVARHFPPAAKARMDELVANLLAAYRVSIGDLDWMTPATKEKAYAKLDRFRPKIGYPVRFRDYSALTVVPGDLVGSVAAANAFETDRQLGKIGSPVDRDEWLMLPQTVNAYYNPGTNEICFPAGILQRPFFAADATDAENYGGIGAVIGHEIGHGFDDQGSLYDGDGNMQNWWVDADREAFETKTKALIGQYDALEPRTLPGEHVNGALTVGENIGDLGGLTIAYKAFLLAKEASGETPTDEERRSLFLNWGHVWRSKRRKEQELQLLTTDPHSPAEFRANIVRNLDEFHALFGTHEGDGLWLAPEDRVRIW